MSDDGEIDYSKCSSEELQDVLKHINKTEYPANYRNLLEAIEQWNIRSVSTVARESQKSPFTIPTGSHGFIEIPLDRKYILPFRIIMLLIAAPFVAEVFEVLTTGVADRGIDVIARGENWGFYAHLAKYTSFALLFLWLGSFGVKDKTASTRDNEP